MLGALALLSVRSTVRIHLALLLLLAARTGHGQVRWSLELYGGTAQSAPSRLTIRQDGEETLRIRARWATRPLADAPYYMYRLERRRGTSGWGAELLHHKVYLRDPPPQVQHFEVSHGYNMLLLGRSWERDGVILRLGAGPVIGRPESRIRGRSMASGRGLFSDGYFVAGPAVQAGAGKRAALWGGLYLSAEAKATAAFARVPVADGSADVPNAAIHGLIGLGYRL